MYATGSRAAPAGGLAVPTHMTRSDRRKSSLGVRTFGQPTRGQVIGDSQVANDGRCRVGRRGGADRHGGRHR